MCSVRKVQTGEMWAVPEPCADCMVPSLWTIWITRRLCKCILHCVLLINLEAFFCRRCYWHVYGVNCANTLILQLSLLYNTAVSVWFGNLGFLPHAWCCSRQQLMRQAECGTGLKEKLWLQRVTTNRGPENCGLGSKGAVQLVLCNSHQWRKDRPPLR